MAQYATDALDGHSCTECCNGKAMAGTVKSNMLSNVTGMNKQWDVLGQRAIADKAENRVMPLVVSVENVDGHRQ